MLLSGVRSHALAVESCCHLQGLGYTGCGKTTWARRHMEENPGKRYVLLSIDAVLQSMRVRPTTDLLFAMLGCNAAGGSELNVDLMGTDRRIGQDLPVQLKSQLAALTMHSLRECQQHMGPPHASSALF